MPTPTTACIACGSRRMPCMPRWPAARKSVGRWHGRYVHIPMQLAVSQRNQVAPQGDLWLAVLEATGQPACFG